MTLKRIDLPINSSQTNLLDLLADFNLSHGVVFYNPSGQIPGFIEQGLCETIDRKSLWVQSYTLDSIGLSIFLEHFQLAFIPMSEEQTIDFLKGDIENHIIINEIEIDSEKGNNITLIRIE